MSSTLCHKAYVSVNLDVDKEGNLYPRAIRWKDGRVFLFERLNISVVPPPPKKAVEESDIRLLSVAKSPFFFMKETNGLLMQRRDMDNFITSSNRGNRRCRSQRLS